MLPVDLHNGRATLSESVEAQVLKVLGNMESILAGHGMSRHNVVSVNIHVTEFKRFQERVDEAYRGFFDSAKLPTRSLVGVDQLPRGAMVSLDFVVHRG
jgi:enamine deaminase RidA (YjgF/YER057c/UK114 family)